MLNTSGAGSNIVVNRGLVVVGDNVFNGNFSDFSGPGTLNILSGTFSTDPTGGPGGSTTEFDVGSGTGSTGTVSQGIGGLTPSSSTVTIGNALYIGYGGGSGAYTLNNGSVLQTCSVASVFAVGINTPPNVGSGAVGSTVGPSGAGSVGILTINDSSSVVIGTGSDLQVGTSTAVGGTAGSGTINQNGGTLTLHGTATAEIGAAAGFSANTYNLAGGTLSVGTTAGDSAIFSLGNIAGSNGTLNQSGGVFIVGSAPANSSTSAFNIGVNGTGVYTMTGGTAVFNDGINVGTNGTVNINGGTLTIAANGINGPGGVNTGNLNLGGGTLKLTPGGGANYAYNFNSNLTGGTSTIDVSTAGITTFTFLNPLTSTGTTTPGINLVGNNVAGAGTTVFNFASAAGGAAMANTYTGSTGISGGTLNALGADFANATAGTTLSFGTPATAAATVLNLTLSDPTTTLPQAITGSGQFNVIFTAAGEKLVLSNTSAALSTVALTLGAGPGGVGAGMQGTLQLLGGSFGAISDNGTASNVIIGNGTAAASVALTGANTFTGTTTVNPLASLSAMNLNGGVVNSGVLNVTNNIGVLATDNVTNNASASLTAGNLTGNVTSNAGTINITGAGGIAGNVGNSGTLIDAGGIGGNVVNTGTLTALNALNVTNTGFLRTVTPLSTFAIGNNFTQNAGGTFLVNVAGVNSDVYTATTAVLTGTVQVQGSSASTTVPTFYNIVTTTGGVTDNGLVTQNSFLLNTSLAVVGNNLVLSVTTNPFMGSTPNQQALADSLNGNPNNPITIAVTANPTLTIADEAGILQSLIPENLQFARFINIENVNYLVQRINGVDADLRNGNGGLDTNAIGVITPGFQSGMGRSLGSLLAYNDPGFHSSAPNGVNYYPGESGRSSPSPAAQSTEPATFDSSSQVISDSPNPYLADVKPGTSETPTLNEFISGDVILADLNKSPSSNANAKANYTAGDVTAGVSFRVTNHFSAGVLFDYNHTDADTDNNGGKTKIDSYTPGIYATYFDHGFYANGLFTVGLNEYDFNSNTFLGQTSGSPQGLQYTGDLDAGYDFHPAKNWIVGPTAGLTYTHVDIDSFTETGAPGAALNVDSQSVDSLRSRLGGHLVYQTNTGDVLLQPSLTAMWQHEFLNDSDGITSSFANTSLNPFTIHTASPSRDSALIGLGMTATLNNSMALYLNYLADVGASNYFSQTVMGGIKARF